jgi:hypothetical protein
MAVVIYSKICRGRRLKDAFVQFRERVYLGRLLFYGWWTLRVHSIDGPIRSHSVGSGYDTCTFIIILLLLSTRSFGGWENSCGAKS